MSIAAKQDLRLRRVTSIRGSLVAGAAASVLFLGGFSAWAFGVPIAGAVIAEGVVVKDGNLQVIRHERGGVLTQLRTREGAGVKAGDLLATLTRPEDRAAVDELMTRVVSLALRQARLAAEQAGAANFSPSAQDLPAAAGSIAAEKLAALVADQRQEFASRAAQLKDTLAVLVAQRRSLEEQQIGTRGEIDALQSQLASLAQDLETRREAMKSGLGKPSVLREFERQQSALEGSLARARSTLAALDHQLEEIEGRMTAEKSAFLQKVGDELSAVRSELLAALENLRGKTETAARVEIRAPVDGVINKMHVNTVGSAVEPFAPLFEIVSDDQPMLIEARVRPADIDEVYPGQEARVALSAFNRRAYDPVPARVEFVSADSRQDRVDQPPYYTIRLSVDADAAAALPPILPGMPSEVFLLTHERTFADYLAEPFIESFDRSFRQ